MDVKNTRPCQSMVIHFSICIAPNIMKKILGNMLSMSTSFLCIQKEAVYLKTRLIDKKNDLAIENARINNGQKFSLDAKFLINLFFPSLSLSLSLSSNILLIQNAYKSCEESFVLIFHLTRHMYVRSNGTCTAYCFATYTYMVFFW